ncbi:hypothetical protein [Hymenobacter sp. BRD67]|uniref:hypothetical protein n=1 Tax=Hymenobacter sp. BRD67 TaxID=2675877 RepID=UPI001565B581|nr:hypothetical protein [Hymenobacter sp. BRD67]QKG52663.1 hypothetical protein GKZ67_08705 [Hymenobacter sp. BRD67]
MQIVHRQRAYDGHFKLNKLTLKTPQGEELPREQFAPGHAVAALVFDTLAGNYLLTRQFRIGPEHELLEIAAGMIDKGETPKRPFAAKSTKSWATKSTSLPKS